MNATRGLAVLVIGFGVALGGIAQAGCGSAESSQQATGRESPAWITEAESRAKYGPALEILRRDQTKRERIEGARAARKSLAHPLAPGENLALRRRVDTPEGPVFVWPAPQGVCYADPGGAVCAGLNAVRGSNGVAATVSGGMQLGTGRALISGLALDGIENVTLTQARRPDVDVPVKENVFLVEVDARNGGQAGLRWMDKNGDRHSRALGNLGPTARGPLLSLLGLQPVLRSLLRKGTSPSPFYTPFDGTSPIYSLLLFTPSGAKIPFALSHIRVK